MRIFSISIKHGAKSLWRSLVCKTLEPVSGALQPDAAYAERFPARKDIEFFEIGNSLTLAVYWKIIPSVGAGPAFSIHAYSSEPLKFDCFGLGEGHYHTETQSFVKLAETRIFLPETTRRAQVDRALFEIEKNMNYFMARSPLLKGKDLRPDPSKLVLACSRARIVAYRFLDTIPLFQD